MFAPTLICMVRTHQTIIDDNKSIELGEQSEFNPNKEVESLDKWTVLHLVCAIGSVVLVLWHLDLVIINRMVEKFNRSALRYEKIYYCIS